MATTVTTVKKSKIGKQDIHFDYDGAGSKLSVPTSSGSTRYVDPINASHIPITTTTRAKNEPGSGTPTYSSTDVDGFLQEVADILSSIGVPDGTMLEVASGILQIAATSITSAKLATNSVTTAKITNDNVTNAKMATNAVAGSASGASGDNCIEAASISATELAADSVVTAKIQDSAVTNAKIADTTIKAAKMVDVPTHYIFLAAEISSTDTSTTLDFTTTGLAATDIIIGTVVSFGTGPNYVKTVAYQSATTIRVTVDTAQSAGTTTMHFLVMRAVTA